MLSVEKPGTPEDLVHFGTKGMKWGVRKQASSAGRTAGRGAKSVGRALGRAADDVSFELMKGTTQVSSHITDKATDRMIRSLPRIKAKHGDYGKLKNRAKRPFSKEARAYRADVKKTYLKHLEKSANEMTNVRGTRQYTLKERGKPNTSKYYWDVSTQPIQHAADDPFAFVAHPIFDDEGWIVDIEIVGDGMAQMVDLGRDFLAHQGVIVD